MRKPGESVVDGEGILREPGDEYFDYHGILRRSDDPFYDSQGLLRYPGENFYDALDFLRSCIDAGAKDRASIRKRLEALGKRAAVTGVFHFSEKDHAGLGPDSLASLEIRNQEFVLLKD